MIISTSQTGNKCNYQPTPQMHGVQLKQNTDEDILKKKKLTSKYLQLNQQLLCNYRNNDFALVNIELLNKVLVSAPSDYTLWNYRSQIVSQQQNDQLLDQEIKFIQIVLDLNSKIYVVWNYRQFIIKQKYTSNSLDVKQEQEFISYFLKNDQRNFHCWNYKRWLALLLSDQKSIQLENDMESTLLLVQKDFSNYSAFYHRYLCIQEYEKQNNEQHCQLIKNEQLLIQKCIFIAPNDEALWSVYLLYFRNQRQLEFIEDIIKSLEDQYDIKPYIYYAKCCLKLQLTKFYERALGYLGGIEIENQKGVIYDLKQQLVNSDNVEQQ